MSRHHHRRGPLMQLERKHEPLLPYGAFLRRVARSVLIGLLIVAGSLAIGVVGYHWSGRLGWLDSLYNASMILGGMGPVDDRGLGVPPAEKWFASFYALYSGLAILVIVGVMFAPLFHRFLHHFHLVEEDEGKSG
jgi:hypothetical protein